MPTCSGPNCRKPIEFLRLPNAEGHLKPIPVDVPIRQRLTLADGNKVLAIVLHHSTCPDVALFKRREF